jgi:hypothetical protein
MQAIYMENLSRGKNHRAYNLDPVIDEIKG